MDEILDIINGHDDPGSSSCSCNNNNNNNSNNNKKYDFTFNNRGEQLPGESPGHDRVSPEPSNNTSSTSTNSHVITKYCRISHRNSITSSSSSSSSSSSLSSCLSSRNTGGGDPMIRSRPSSSHSHYNEWYNNTTMWWITALLFITHLAVATSGQDYTCAYNYGDGNIIPRGDQIMNVGSGYDAYCIFNSSIVDVKDVYFLSRETSKPHIETRLDIKVLNNSAIMARIERNTEGTFNLRCMKGERRLCSRRVSFGYPPLDVENFTCITPDDENIVCNWTLAKTSVPPYYTVYHSVPGNREERKCNLTKGSECRLNLYVDTGLREKRIYRIHGNNSLGEANYTHVINLQETVIPKKVSIQVKSTSAFNIYVSYKYHSLTTSLYHEICYRIAGEKEWIRNITHIKTPMPQVINQKFVHNVKVKYAYTKYEIRVRLHTGVVDKANIKPNMWSPYQVKTIETLSTVPLVGPKVSISSFSISNKIDNRTIYIYWEKMDQLLYNGPDFTYSIHGYQYNTTPMVAMIVPSDKGYVQFLHMNFEEYKFQIIPQNANGVGNETATAEIIVPARSEIPPPVEYFTVHTSIQEGVKIFSLIWRAHRNSRTTRATKAESYTVYWCHKSDANFCDENQLNWDIVDNPEVIMFGNLTYHTKKIYGKPGEQNVFGISANVANVSSGIIWSSCIIHDTNVIESPSKLEVKPRSHSTLQLSWSLKCESLAAVPAGFIISYCEVEVAEQQNCKRSYEVYTKYVDANLTNNKMSLETLLQENLRADTTYKFTVAIETFTGQFNRSKESDPVYATMLEDKPGGPPITFSLKNVTDTSAVFSWEPPSKDLRNGKIHKYVLRIKAPLAAVKEAEVVMSEDQMQLESTVDGLYPNTIYEATIFACTKFCSDHKVQLSFTTKPGVPGGLQFAYVDPVSMKATWGLDDDDCNAPVCKFDLQLFVNNKPHPIITLDANRESYDLRQSTNFTCNKNETFIVNVRARSESDDVTLTGPWKTTLEKTCAVKGPMPLWMIIVIASICIGVTLTILIVGHNGWAYICNIIEKARGKIQLPPLIRDGDSKIKEDPASKGGGGALDYRLIPQNSNMEDIKRDRHNSAETSVSLRSCDQDGLITSDRSRRTRSGGSAGSSGVDSAVVGCSTSSHESDTTPTHPTPRTIMNQLSEGYCIVRSTPSLGGNFCDNINDLSFQHSTPNLAALTNKGENVQIQLTPLGTRRASTGYVSMPESDSDRSTPGVDSLSGVSIQRSIGKSMYSHHSFTPPSKIDGTVNGTTGSLPWINTGYITAHMAEEKVQSMGIMPPINNAYVSAGISQGVKRQPSLPSLVGNADKFSEDDHPSGAYCKVGNRSSPPRPVMQNYVTINHAMSMNHSDDPPTNIASTNYPEESRSSVTCNNTSAPLGVEEKNPSRGYVTVGGMWSQIIPRSSQGEEGRNVSSAPVNNTRARGTQQCWTSPKENSERDGKLATTPLSSSIVPSLSKQSSGYVSQGSLFDPVVVSPRRLLAQTSEPHSVILSPSHQVSMV